MINDEDFTDYYKDFLSDEELEIFLHPRLFSRDLMLDDPIDFINGFNLALAFIYRTHFNNTNEEAQFRISLAMWLKKFIDNVDNTYDN